MQKFCPFLLLFYWFKVFYWGLVIFVGAVVGFFNTHIIYDNNILTLYMRHASVSKLQINIKRPGKLFLLSQEFCSSYKVLVSLVKTFLPKHSTHSPSQGATN